MKLKTAWNWFSKYIRKRDCLAFREQCNEHTGEYVKCVTCNAIKPWKEMDAGHYFHAGTSVPQSQFDERNVHAQCAQCNTYLSGNMKAYADFMMESYGQDVIDELKVLSKQPLELTQEVLKEFSDKYRLKFKEIENG